MARVVITQKSLAPQGALRGFGDARHGAWVLFAGAVRGSENGRPLRAIRYQAYVPMARKVLETVASRAERKFNARVALLHRHGRVPVKGISLLVACATAHRADAFAAARWVVEQVKKDAPFWKIDFEGDSRS